MVDKVIIIFPIQLIKIVTVRCYYIYIYINLWNWFGLVRGTIGPIPAPNESLTVIDLLLPILSPAETSQMSLILHIEPACRFHAFVLAASISSPGHRPTSSLGVRLDSAGPRSGVSWRTGEEKVQEMPPSRHPSAEAALGESGHV